MWRWDQAEPFGNNPADEDPDANSVAFDLPLRQPGQRYDAETGLHYNYFRDYDPSLGIYKQSDPIGLEGGVNTYAYVFGSPLMYADPTGEGVQLPIAVGAGVIRICLRMARCANLLKPLIKRARDLCKRVHCELRFDTKGHKFEILGGLRCQHYQVTCYIKDVKGSDINFHSPIPVCWKDGQPPITQRPPPHLP